MSSTTDFIAVDLGASSGRVIVGKWNGRVLSLEELHRFSNEGVYITGSLHWDVLKIWTEIQNGPRRYARERRGSPVSIGVDAWGVDFALIDRFGRMMENPCHYRDSRTNGIPKHVFATISESDIFNSTGVQTMQINTLFQLYSMVLASDPKLGYADTFLMIPDLFSYFLGGIKSSEASIASTTQMYMPLEKRWASALLSSLNISQTLFPAVSPSGTIRSSVRSDVLRNTGLHETFPVVSVASHDTASAVAAIPNLDSKSAFISSGTWSLMGIEVAEPITSEMARALGFTNEIGANSSILFLKNLTGLWTLQECMACWARNDRWYSWDEITTAASLCEPFRSLIDPNAIHFLSPTNMLDAIRSYCSSTGQFIPNTVGEVTRCCFESLCLKYRSVLDSLERLTARKISTVRIVGGGCLNSFLCQMSSDACDRPAVSGPAEASSFGNVILQAVATNHFLDIDRGRAIIAESTQVISYEPRQSDAWFDAYERFAKLEMQESLLRESAAKGE